MFRKKQRMLKMVDYTVTPEHSPKAAIEQSELPVWLIPHHLQMSQDHPLNPCTFVSHHLTDYGVVHPVLLLYRCTERDPRDGHASVVTTVSGFLPEDLDLIGRKQHKRKHLNQRLAEA